MHAVACVKDGDRGRTLRSCALWRALVEFYGEGKGGSNPEGEVVEDEVRGPTVWSVSVFRARPGRRVLGTTRAMHAFPFIPFLFPHFCVASFCDPALFPDAPESAVGGAPPLSQSPASTSTTTD